MTYRRPFPNRRRAQRGAVVRGLLVVLTLAAGLGLQLAGPRLQRGLAAWAGIAGIAPRAAACASTPSSAGAMHSRKVAAAVVTAPAPAL